MTSLITQEAPASLINPLLRTGEACAALGGISVSTLDRLVIAGKLRRIKISPRISAYFASEIAALIDASTSPCATQEPTS